MGDVPVCDWPGCTNILRPNQELFDKQAQTIEVVFAAYKRRINLCETHMQEVEQFQRMGTLVMGGLIPAREALSYLPKGD